MPRPRDYSCSNVGDLVEEMLEAERSELAKFLDRLHSDLLLKIRGRAIALGSLPPDAGPDVEALETASVSSEVKPSGVKTSDLKIVTLPPWVGPNSSQHSSASSWDEMESEETIWPLWQKGHQEPDHQSRRMSKMSAVSRMNSVQLSIRDLRQAKFKVRVTESRDISYTIQRFILSPHSTRYLFWQTLGCMFILLDVIWIPLQVFDFPENDYIDLMSWITVTYWIMECALQFITGFELRSGILEMRFGHIVYNYVTSWLLIDLVVIVVELISLIIGRAGKTSTRAWNISKQRKALKIVKAVKLLRLIKVWGMRNRVFTFIRSERMLIISNISWIIVGIVLSGHYLACCWFSVGSWEAFHHKPYHNWLELGGPAQYGISLRDAEISLQYAASLQWAMAQSGLASTDIVPINLAEHIFSILTTLLWLCLLAGTTSIFVVSLVRLRDVNRHQVTQEALMRKYLCQNKVSKSLTERTLRYFQRNFAACLQRTHEKDLEFFRELPMSLQVQLHRAIYKPILKTHLLFCQLRPLFDLICHVAMSERHFNGQQRIFQEHDQLQNVFYLVDGALDYHVLIDDEPRRREISNGTWIGEPTLWIKGWTCRGRLQAVSSAEMVCLSAPNFREIIENASETEVEDLIDKIQSYVAKLTQMCLESDLLDDADLLFSVTPTKSDERRRSDESTRSNS